MNTQTRIRKSLDRCWPLRRATGEPAYANPPPRRVAAVTCQQWLRRNDKDMNQ